MVFPCLIERLKIRKHMKSVGFERYVIKLKTFDDIPVWGYRRADTNETITEEELFEIGFRQIKYKFMNNARRIQNE